MSLVLGMSPVLPDKPAPQTWFGDGFNHSPVSADIFPPQRGGGDQAEVPSQRSSSSVKEVRSRFKLQRDVLQPRLLQFLLHQLWRTTGTCDGGPGNQQQVLETRAYLEGCGLQHGANVLFLWQKRCVDQRCSFGHVWMMMLLQRLKDMSTDAALSIGLSLSH